MSGIVIAEYGYDPFGRRLWKEVNGTRTYFLYADEGLIAEYDANGNELRSYGYQPDAPGARRRCGSMNGSGRHFFSPTTSARPGSSLTWIMGA
ncbi:MAG: hypothetical protein RBT80_01390 [Candidatus Vecturithrix sp.]|nr:hypothetical protein [Candidatus Vecturithrix sp.]